MLSHNARKNARVAVNMSLRSASLPRYQAHIVDLSKSGARIRLKGAVSQALENQRIRFGVSLSGEIGTHFEGLARVAWVSQTASGWEAGLEWEKLTPADWNLAGLAANAA
jgi:hypothetical protein